MSTTGETGSPDGSGEREYLLGTSSEELRRLGFQHQVWAENTAAAWRHAGFRPGQRLLDAGCGPGFASFDLARLVGDEGEVVAVDLSQRFLTHLEAEAKQREIGNIVCSLQDVENLDLPSCSFDGAFARWLLCFTARPEAVVSGVARALRQGGRFVVIDYVRYDGFTIAPSSEAFRRVIRTTGKSFRMRGGSGDIGQDLPRLLTSSGFVVERINPIVRVGRPGTALWKWPESFFASFLHTLVDLALITESDSREFTEEWEVRSADPAAFFITPPMVEIIAARQ
ncbi:MAG TPA: methyltransferase domain-containing protein [Thermoanaerobaculia bacterium]|nr:methyltransferase domain-containing protein [Thermoanaerobaculia bacterium]